jgi:hypothetical protein
MITKQNKFIDQQELKQLLVYDSNTGIFTWKTSLNPKIKIGSVAGHKDNKGYIRIKLNGKSYKAHRLAWLYVYGLWPVNIVDHINNIKDDNRILNLREASDSENQYNSLLRKSNTSGFKGVYFHKKKLKWIAQCRVDKKLNYIGQFDSVLEANEAVMEFRKSYHGEFYNNGNL